MGTNITGIGNANAIGFKSRVTGGAYFPPELKDALVGVWSAYGKSNDSTDRNIIKNKIKDKGGDFELLNFNYKEGSGYGKYGTDFLNWNVETSSVTASSNKIEVIKESNMYKMYRYSSMTKNLPSFKVKISNLQKGYIRYYYRKQTGIEAYIDFHQNGIYELPASYKVDEGGTGTNGGFNSNAAVLNVGVTIEQIPEFKGAVVTDGIDDLIISTKTATEMGITNEVTVVSMIHQIGGINSSAVNYGYTNYFRGINHSTLRNNATGLNKTGIYGYSATNYTPTIINNILGDKNDYTTNSAGFSQSTYNNVFSVEGYKVSSMIAETSQVAWYWTFIANKVLTEDEINLVIEKYNLDRPGEIVTPQVYYNVKKQKITNDNHSAFDDKLIDYSGNGYDAKLYNFGWKEDSGIGKYETDFTDWKKSFKVTSFDSESIKFTSDVSWALLYHPSSIGEDIPSFKVRIKLYGKGTLYYNYITQEGKYTNVAVKSEIFETPICYNTKYTGEKGVNVGFTLGVISGECSGTITQIPEYENALVLDGVDDYGKVTGLPILKDYTFLVDRQIINIGDVQRIVASKSESATDTAKQGAFLFEYLSKNSISTWSYYENNPLVANADFNRDISYQSKYIYNGKELTIGGAGDSDKLWLGTIRDNDSRFFNGAIYLLMLFPYSMSEFLIERQIEKVKGGTLYPNQVEFRPIIPEDENITKIDYFVVNSGTWTVIKPGDYVDVGARIVLNVYTKLPYKIAGASSTAFTGMTVGPSTALNIWDVKGYIKDKTPQKIKLTLAVNEDIVQWNPAITSNLLDSFTASSWYLNGWDNTLTVGTWIKKTDRVFFKATFKTELYGLETATFGGTECVVSKADNWSDSKNIWDIRMLGTVGDLSQIFNLDVYELIRFEDIVQPYPVLLRFKDENGNEVSWGGKFRVGSTITRIGSAADSNLLPNIYNIFGLLLNDNQVTSSKVIVEKTMVFKAKSAYIFDNNEPKCILSPSRLRIPNSSYKILGHIPDISGHGNHGVIHNSAYAEMSGADGYPYDYNKSSFWCDSVLAKVVSGELIEYFAVKNSTGFSNITSGVYKGEIKVTGVTKAISENKISQLIIYTNSTTDNELIDITQDGNYNIDIKGVGDANRVFFYAIPNNPNESIVVRLTEPIYIEQVGEYEGAYCLDGVDDYISIPTLVTKQSLIKCNWTTENYNKFLLDYRKDNASNGYSTNKTGRSDTQLAYNGRVTYIDGILNKNLIPDDNLKGITHCAVIQYPNNVESETTIASAFDLRGYMQMALYTYIAFSEFSTEEKIKELNEYVGTEGNIVEWNPTITSNIPYKDISTYITTDGTTDLSPKVGNLYKKGDKLTIGIKPAKDLDEVGTVTINGVKIKRSSLTELGYYIYDTVLDSTQIIDITIDEYIKYEDIVQPFPTIFELKNIDTNVTYTYGSKLKIGSEFLFDKWTNLLPELYRPTGSGRYNGNEFKTGNTYTVERTMTFSWSSPMEYLLSSAPKCIFSPSKLRMPNESYRYLGYIPDISGNGNNGVFNNFAFSKMSGADGYPYDYKSTSDFVVHARNAVLVNSETVKFINVLTQTSFYYKGTSYKGKIKVTGITKAIASGKVRYLDIYSNSPTNNDRVIIDKDGIYDVNIETEDAINIFFYLTPIVSGTTALDEPVYLEQVGNYEGSICFDGVDDYMDIPSLSIGGKQVLMKTNWLKSPTLLYDQRASGSFAILTTNEDDATNPRIAYQARNQDGKTYIDGIENNYIETYSLKGITHNITVTNPSAGSGVVPVIGANTGKSSSFAKMALYDFMLFDEASTNEEIKQLNDIVGIEGNYVQKPPYYWDTHGKSNLDGDRGTIPQLGTAEDYSFTSFDNEIDWYLSSSNYIDVVSRNGYKITLKNLSTGIDGWRFQNSTVKRFILNDIPFKIKSNKTIRVYWDMHYNAISSTELRQKVVSVTTINPNEDTLINLRHLTEEELTELNVNKSTMYYLLWFDVSTLAVNEEVTIEMLPVEGGRNLWLNNYNFAYDKMSGFGGYEFDKFTNTSRWIETKRENGIEVIEKNDYSFTAKRVGTGEYFWDFKNNSIRTLDKELTVKAVSNNNVSIRWEFKYRTAEKPDIDSAIVLVKQAMTPNVPITVTLPYKTEEEQAELGVVEGSTYYLFYFDPSYIPVNEEYTVEMLPLYPNGLVYDGVDDYSENISIPAFTDYTYIFKRTLLNKKYNSASVFKGSNQQSGGGAFICDYNSVEPELMIQGYSFGAGLYANSLNTNDIVYGTKNSVNGQTITSGNNADTEGLTIGKWRAYKQMVFYKLMLYPRTTDMLTINMIKNMMAEDGIIDIQGKLFTDKYTGDFNLDFNKDFLIGN